VTSLTRQRALLIGVALSVMAALTVAAPTAAFAQPANDSFSSPVAVTGLPFTTTVDTTEATADPTDPTGCSANGSVWFTFTPATDMRLQVDTVGSDYDTVLSAWTGGPGSFQQVACNDDTIGLQSRITVAATAGTTYHFMVARCCGDGGSGGGSLRFTINQIQPAINDDFADAVTIAAVPYADIVDFGTASGEPGEPGSCFEATATVWYAYTPTATRSI